MDDSKTGVELKGVKAKNPYNGELIPVFISDYVLTGYGTGAIMAVPAHDQRDYDFAKAFNLPIVQVLEGGDIAEKAWEEDGAHINSGFLNGMNKEAGGDRPCGEKRFRPRQSELQAARLGILPPALLG